eukprot:501770-Hanusia_phi.AAC.3
MVIPAKLDCQVEWFPCLFECMPSCDLQGIDCLLVSFRNQRLLSGMGLQSSVARFLDGPNGANNKKLVKNLFVFGVAIAVLYNWEVVIGDLDETPNLQ